MKSYKKNALGCPHEILGTVNPETIVIKGLASFFLRKVAQTREKFFFNYFMPRFGPEAGATLRRDSAADLVST